MESYCRHTACFASAWIFIYQHTQQSSSQSATIESPRYQSLAGGSAFPFSCMPIQLSSLTIDIERVSSSSSFIIKPAPPARILQSCSMFKGAKAEGGARRGRASGSGGAFGCRASTFMDGNGLRLGLDENPDGIISGEWPENFSLISYDDVRAYLQSQQQAAHVGDQQQRGALLREAMSTPVLMATADQTLGEVEGHFEAVSGLPVVDSARRCVGVVVKSDRTRASHGSKTKIAQVMTSPAITLSCDKTVTDAAALMLKKKIHRLPIVNQDNQVIGIVTRDDVLRALEAMLKI